MVQSVQLPVYLVSQQDCQMILLTSVQKPQLQSKTTLLPALVSDLFARLLECHSEQITLSCCHIMLILQNRNTHIDLQLHPDVCRSSGLVMHIIRRYPFSFAFGFLSLVFVLPNLVTIGLAGIERTALAFLLELEELLVSLFLAGAKWVSLRRPVQAKVNGIDTECTQNRLLLHAPVQP